MAAGRPLFNNRDKWRGEMRSVIPRRTISSASSRWLHWLIGRPEPLGCSHAKARVWHTCSGVSRGCTPGRGASASRLAIADIARTPGDVNARVRYDEPALEELTASVREHGVLQPVLVRPVQTDEQGVWTTPDETRLFAAWEADQLRQPATVELVTAEGWADLAKLDAMHSAILAWGDHPDAIFAIIGVTAVGWVPLGPSVR